MNNSADMSLWYCQAVTSMHYFLQLFCLTFSSLINDICFYYFSITPRHLVISRVKTLWFVSIWYGIIQGKLETYRVWRHPVSSRTGMFPANDPVSFRKGQVQTMQLILHYFTRVFFSFGDFQLLIAITKYWLFP